MKLRVSRKSKKWHRKMGYKGPYFTHTGKAYWLKSAPIRFKVSKNWYTESF